MWVPSNMTVQSPNNLGPRENTVTVTDANNCQTQASRNLSEPDKAVWGMTGNTGTNPATQYLGTADNVDFVFKTNGSERMRLKGV